MCDLIVTVNSEEARSAGIVKWYGGFDNLRGRINKFGFLQDFRTKQDTRVHEQDLLCASSLLREGALVSFRTVPYRGRLKAVDVRLISPEQDTNTVRDVCRTTPSLSAKKRLLMWLLLTGGEQAIIEFAQEILPTSEPRVCESIVSFLPANLRQRIPAARLYLPVDLLLADWKRVAASHLSTQDVESEIAEVCRKRPDVSATVVKHLPPRWLAESVFIRPLLSRRDELELRIRCLCEENSPEARMSVLRAIDTLRNTDTAIWDLIPPSVVLAPEVWERAPGSVRSRALAVAWSDGQDDKIGRAILRVAPSFLETLSASERYSIWSRFPAKIRWSPELRNCAEPDDELNVVVAQQPILMSREAWEWLSWRARILAIYRAAKTGRPGIGLMGGDHPLPTAVLKVVHLADASVEEKRRYASVLTETLLSWVADRAWDPKAVIDLRVLFPACPVSTSGVPYCEGKLMAAQPEFESDVAYCPRIGRVCNVVTGPGRGQARVRPVPRLDYTSWSLMELFDSLSFVPIAEGLANAGEFAPRFAGWLNRLHEIRARLHCSVCGEFLKPNFAYSKKLTARYRLTVAGCSRGEGHDGEIYFNHCWCCRHIIDSRESPIRIEDYYLCIHCGCGPRGSSTYRVGDMCPKCGRTELNGSDSTYRCVSCGHTFSCRPHCKRVLS
jgi:hypothetical protein